MSLDVSTIALKYFSDRLEGSSKEEDYHRIIIVPVHNSFAEIFIILQIIPRPAYMGENIPISSKAKRRLIYKYLSITFLVKECNLILL